LPGFKELEAGLQTIGPPILSSKRHVSRLVSAHSISAYFLHNLTVTIIIQTRGLKHIPLTNLRREEQ